MDFRRPWMTSPALITFFFLYVFSLWYCHETYYRDPTSKFFDPTRAYQPVYSAFRQHEAETFVHSAAERSFHRTNHNNTPGLCIGIATVRRDSARYFPMSVGALLHGLTESERQDIHLITLIAHTDPIVHPAYSEAWLHNLADEVLTYDLTPEQLLRIQALEGEKGLFREKALFDYRYLLNACYNVGAPNIIMIEDDVLPLDGWYQRTMKAIQLAEIQTHLKGISDYLYLRLFYTEEFLGWNSEEWPTYLFCSIIATSVPLIVMLAIRVQHKTLARILTNSTIAFICGICIPLSILLFFAAGKNSMLPLSAGVNEMPKFGCCSQSLAFPRSKVPRLLDWYAEKKVGFVDMLTEELADRENELRWALTPSPMQHIGRKSSKGDDFGKNSKHHLSVAEKLWNFNFELFDPLALRREHQEDTRT